MRRWIGLAAAALSLAACSQGEGGSSAPEVAQEAAAPAGKPGMPDAVVPQIAYTYGFRFDLPAGHVAALQARHLGLCDRLGAGCRVVEMQQASGRDGDAGGSLKLAVATAQARRFGDALVASGEAAGGETASRTVTSEDLSRRIVDVEAHLRGRQALADRLLGVVRGHGGSIADLVAAEKALAEVQEQIDTARSRLAEARGRVAMSTLEIAYDARAGFGIIAPIGDSLRGAGSVAGASLAALLTLLVAVAPWTVLLALAFVAQRRWRRRGDPPE